MADPKTHKGGGAYIAGRYRYADSHDMLALLGVKRLPAEGMPERLIQGVRVYVRPLPAPTGKLSAYTGRPVRNFRGLRVMAICDCGQHVPVGRLHQHRCKTMCCTAMERDGSCREHLGMRFGVPQPQGQTYAQRMGEADRLARCSECGGYLGDYGNCVTAGCGGGA